VGDFPIVIGGRAGCVDRGRHQRAARDASRGRRRRLAGVRLPEGPPDAWRSLGDGFATGIEITVWSSPDVVQVPTSAIFREGSGWAVFTVLDERAVVRPVELGHRGPLKTEILSRLQPDEVVVIHPGASVHRGVRVASR
jgi:HlyD family secretion protein